MSKLQPGDVGRWIMLSDRTIDLIIGIEKATNVWLGPARDELADHGFE